MTKGRRAALEMAQALCREHASRLLYLACAGSTLYGTAVAGRSDLDCRGIFLPSPQSLALGKTPASLRSSTAGEHLQSGPDDVDVCLWPLQRWLLELLARGDSGAMDLLFSFSCGECVLFKDAFMDRIFAEPLRVLSLAGGRSCAKYCIGQAERYSLKGERLNVLKRVRAWLDSRCPHMSGLRLQDLLSGLLRDCGHAEHCRAGTDPAGAPALVLDGRVHLAGMPLREFSGRLDRAIAAYGARAEAAEAGGGADFKALAHAVRAASELQELLSTGRIAFPLACAGELMEIREGRLSKPEAVALVRERLALSERLLEDSPFAREDDPKRAPALVLEAYGLQEGGSAHGGSAHGGDGPEPVLAGTAQDAVSDAVSDALPDALPKAAASGLDAVPASLLRQIQERLDACEREHHVRILYACEAGSRAWGCPSKDSDWDVRFIYAHHPDWYLDVAEKKDVIEATIEQGDGGVFDAGGWDVRKALRLYGGSNAAVFEWIRSPFVYRRRGPLLHLLRRHADTVFSPIAAWHHYKSLAAGMLKADPDPQARTAKRWTYILRPLLVLRWLEGHEGVPPAALADLLAQAGIGEAVRDGVQDLLLAKLAGAEKGFAAPPQAVQDFAREAWERVLSGGFQPGHAKGRIDLGEIFRICLREAWDGFSFR